MGSRRFFLSKKKRKKSALGLRILTIEVWLLLVVSIVFLAFAIANHDYFGFSIALVALATTALAYFLRRTFDDLSSMNSIDEAAESRLYDFFTSGYLFLPKRIRAGASENVYLMLFRTQLQSSAVEKDNEGNEDQRLFRVTLDAAGVLTAGDNQRHYSIKSNVLLDYWNCSFPTSGDQVINLRVELVKDKERPRIIEDVFLLEHYVRVTSLLRDSWEPILVLVPAVVTSISIALMMVK